MLRALTANLVAHERIETTDAKAKELRRVAERLLSHAIRLGTVAYTPGAELNPADKARRLAATRQVGSFLQRFGVKESDGESRKVDLVEKVFVDLAKRFQGRPGGYTRTTKLGPRRGDGAHMTIIEFIDAEPPVDKVAPTAAPEAATAGPSEVTATAAAEPETAAS